MTAVPAAALVGLVLCVATMLASARLWRRCTAGRLRTALLIAQPLLAVLLYLALFPPLRPAASTVMTVLTADAAAVRRTDDSPASGLRIALPEAARSHAEAFPDLATALRRHPEVTRLHVVGAGLTARDREAARRYPLTFAAIAAPTGLVELDVPPWILVGNAFRVNGRIAGLPGATVELLDPAAQTVQRVNVDRDGRFSLFGAVRAAGTAQFSLLVHNAAGALHETLPLPLHVTTPPSLRLLVLAGTPGPELKYLRRWALDAGITLHTRISAGADLTLGDASVALDERTLGGFDAVLLDLRALRTLRDADREALDTAVHAGLGLLLRIDDPPTASERRLLQAWGFDGDAATALATVRLPEQAALPSLTRRVLRADENSVPMLRDSQGQPLAWWRAQGLGRIGVMTLTDTYRLTLAGFGDRHGELWSTLLGSLARLSRGQPPITTPWPIWQAERATFCGLSDPAEVLVPDGTRMALAIDPATDDARCAALWTTQAGWHQLRQGETATPFAVLPAGSGAAWRAQRQLDATALLAARAPDAPVARADAARRSSSLPWFAAWLLLSTLVWLAERREKTAALLNAAEAVGKTAA